MTTPSDTLPPVLIIPGLRDASTEHWQWHLEQSLRPHRQVHAIPALGKDDLRCQARVEQITAAIESVGQACIAVAHSGGCIALVHWAMQAWPSLQYHLRPAAAILAAPPDFETPLPDGYPTLDALSSHDWLPVPMTRLPFPTVVLSSTNDPLARIDRVEEMAGRWGAQIHPLGPVGHLNPASGFGLWPQAPQLIDALARGLMDNADMNDAN